MNEKDRVGYGDARVAAQEAGYARPYDFRWGAAQQVQDEFHISPVTLKAAAAAGHIKALQPTYQDEEHRAQCVYCFEDIHNFMENVLHKLSREYVKRFWTYPELISAARRMPTGPYQRLDDMGGGHGEDRGERSVG